MTTKKPKKIKTTVNNYIYCYKKGIKSFSEINIPDTVISIDISGNPMVSSFEGLSQFPVMTTLKANGTSINTFIGAKTQISLLNLSLLNTPLSKEKYLTLMALLSFGPSLRNVNGKMISPQIRNFSYTIKSRALPYLERGYLISQIEPDLKVHLPGSYEDIIVDLELKDFIEKENLIKNNDKTIQEMKLKLLQLKKEKREKKQSQVNTKKLLDSFIGQSPPKKSPKKATTNRKINTTSENEVAKSKSQMPKGRQQNTNVISPTQAFKKQNTCEIKNENTKEKSEASTIETQNEQKGQEIEQENEEVEIDKNEDSPIISGFQDQHEDYDAIFKFSDDEKKEEEESPDSLNAESQNNNEPKNMLITSNFPDDDQLIDIAGASSPNQNNEKETEQDLYNEILEGDKVLNYGKYPYTQDTNELDENIIGTNVEDLNFDDENIFDFSKDELEDDEDPSIAAIKVEMNTKPKNLFATTSDFPDDDQMIDLHIDNTYFLEEEEK